MNSDVQLIAVQALPAIESISATEAALKQRDELLTLARRGTSITTAEQAQKAGAFLKRIADFTRTIEETRKTVKAPVLDVGKRIDAVATELTRDLDAELKRISGLLGAFAAEQKRKEEEARRKAWEEQERIRLDAERREREAREKEERERKAKEEADRKAQEELRAAAERARSEKGRAAREAELKAAQEKADRERAEREQQERDAAEKRRQEAEAASRAAAQVVIPAAPKLAGISTGSNICFEVTDIVALYEAHPMFVNLTPNTAAIKSALKQLPEGKALPGVRHWREAKAVVR